MAPITAHPLLLWWVFLSLCGFRCASISLSRDSRRAHGKRSSTRKRRGCGPNLAVFFDGSLFHEGVTCSEAKLHVADDHDSVPKKHGDHHNCESNIPVMYNLAKDAAELQGEEDCPSGQLAHYVNGVGRDATDNFETGVGTWARAVTAYKWLAKHYDGTNRIFLFGASRGGLSARMVQGLVHKFGLARNEALVEELGVPYEKNATEAGKFRNNKSKSWEKVKIRHVGLIESVLRSLSDWHEHWNIKAMGMRMTAAVEHASVAVALDDARMIYETHELYMDPATQADQVWFSGQHRDVMGGFPMSGLARIVAGWTLDHAEAHGLLLPADWWKRNTMRGDYMEYAGFTAGFGPWSEVVSPGISLEKTYRYAKVKNPNQCREKEPDRKVRIHQSVKDRMDKNKGYVPQPFCCQREVLVDLGVKDKDNLEELGYDLSNIEYVSNRHYEYWRNQASDHPTWFKISFGTLGVQRNDIRNGEKFFLRVTTWSDRKVREGEQSGKIKQYKGHSSIVKYSPKGEKRHENHQEFSDHPVVIPWLYATTRLLVEVDQLGEDGWIWDGKPPNVGRVEIRLDEVDEVLGKMKEYDVMNDPPDPPKKKREKKKHVHREEEDVEEHVHREEEDVEEEKVGTLEIKVATINTDAEAKEVMPKEAPAMCQWLHQHSGLKWTQLCKNTAVPLLFFNQGSSHNCEDFMKEIVTGNRSAPIEKSEWHQKRDAEIAADG